MGACTGIPFTSMHSLLIKSYGLPALGSNHQIPINSNSTTNTGTTIEMSRVQLYPAVTVVGEGNELVGRQFLLWGDELSITWSSKGNCYMCVYQTHYIFIKPVWISTDLHKREKFILLVYQKHLQTTYQLQDCLPNFSRHTTHWYIPHFFLCLW